ncbi:MAG: hypothetical protein IK093_08825 [Ruminiclostridium sp.]|nr:hypothetical protein [Ruminiclostridium sp.]
MITNTMSALMSAGTTLKQAQVQHHALKKDEGHAGILKAEIEHSVKTDTSAKQAELKETEEHAADLKSKQTDTLEAATTELRDNIDRAREADREEAKKSAKAAEKKKSEKIEKEKKTSKLGNAPETDENGETANVKSVSGTEKTEVIEPTAVEAPDPFRAHKPIDITV